MAPHWPAPWGRDAGPDDQLAIEDELSRAGVDPTGQPDRARVGRPDDRGRRDARAAAPVAARHPRRLRAVVPALQRARGRLRPGRPAHPGRARRRPVRGERTEDLEHVGQPQRVGDPAGPHRSRRAGPSRHLVLRGGHAQPGHRGAADHRDDRRQPLQRDVPHRRDRSPTTSASAPRTRGGRWPRSRSATSGSRCRRAGCCGAWDRPRPTRWRTCDSSTSRPRRSASGSRHCTRRPWPSVCWATASWPVSGTRPATPGRSRRCARPSPTSTASTS